MPVLPYDLRSLARRGRAPCPAAASALEDAGRAAPGGGAGHRDRAGGGGADPLGFGGRHRAARGGRGRDLVPDDLADRAGAALAHDGVRADQPAAADAGRHPHPARPGYPAGPDQRRLVQQGPARPAARQRAAHGRVGRRARPDRAHRHPPRGGHSGHPVPAGGRGTEPAGAAGPAEPSVMETIRLAQPGAGIAEITLDRPAAMNAVSSAMAEELTRACEQLATASEVRVVVFSAAGDRAFSAGADLKERAGLSDADIMRQRHVIRGLFGALLALPQPAVAAVHGFALGGGCELAMSCDLVVADETAVFGLPEVTVGLVPGGGGTQLALRRLGPGRAADLVLTGRKVGIDEAERFGLVDRRVPAGQDGPAALDLAGQIAANSPVAVRAAKRAIRHGWGVSLEAGLDIEDAAWRTAALSADRREGIAAFVEKRKPAWPGQ